MQSATTALVLACSGALLAGCGSSTADATSTSTSTGATTTTGGGPGGSGGHGPGGGGGATTGSGGAGGATTGSGGAGGADYTPTPGDIQFGAHLPLPAGESILFNDWNATPNRVLAMKPDGSGAAEVFRAHRIWSMGATPDGAKIAFACGDPQQKAHYGLELGDAIQHSWIYDAASQSIELVAKGNINDECHVFGPDRAWLYVCRRYDFAADFSSKGYRVGRIELATRAFEWLADEGPMTLHPTPTADETALFFTRILVSGGKQSRTLVKEPLPPGPIVDVVPGGSAPRLSPDGTRLLYTDYGAGGTLWSMKLDGTDRVMVVDAPASDAHWSPDGTRVVYLLDDQPQNCAHVEIARADGSEAAAPVRVRDCAGTGEFVTGVDWVARTP